MIGYIDILSFLFTINVIKKKKKCNKTQKKSIRKGIQAIIRKLEKSTIYNKNKKH